MPGSSTQGVIADSMLRPMAGALSPFSEFTIDGALIECSLKEAELAETA